MSARIEYTCGQCGTKFIDYRSNHRRYCSNACAGKNGPKTHGLSKKRLYTIWCDMKNRCYCKSSPGYEYYGARGITVCGDWIKSFKAFRDWALASGYKDHLTLDRRRTTGNYDPRNCRWATRQQQMANTQKRRDAETSKYKGVHWHAKTSKWRALGWDNKKPVHLGMFTKEADAARAYDRWAIGKYGEFANPNFKRSRKTQGGVPS